MTLGQGRAIGADQERDMAECRHRQLQGLEDQYLPRRVGEMVFATQHMGHAHGRIIHGIAEEERGRSIGTAHDEITNVVAQEALCSMHEIDELNALAQWYTEAQRRGEARGTPGGPLLGTQMPAGAGVPGWLAGRDLGFSGHFQFQGRAVALIDPVGAFKSGKVLGIAGGSLRLAVGPPAILAAGTRVPLQTQPGQILLLVAAERLAAARRIRVLDAQDKAAPDAAGEQEAEQRGAGIPQVQIAAWAGRETRYGGRPGGQGDRRPFGSLSHMADFTMISPAP